MKKTIALILSVLMLIGAIPASGSAEPAKLRIVTTIFPIYDWVREIAGGGENAEITLLLDSGVDLHSFQPSAEDIMKVATCDVFIYVGGESDEWVEDVLSEAAGSDLAVINLMDVLGEGAKAEETVEGMEVREEESPDGEEEETDEHVWLSLRNARLFVSAIAGVLAQADPEHAEGYRNNAEAYAGRLAELDAEYTAATRDAAFRTLLFGDRFPFRYLTDDYGLSYYAAFPGCSAETEASFQTIVFLSRKTDELGLPAVMTIEGTNHQIAETIIANTSAKNQKLLVLNSMQGTTAQDIRQGATYLKIMEENLKALREALN